MKHVSEKLVDKFINVVNNEYKKNGTSEQYLKCMETCYKTENIPFMIEFAARVKGFSSDEFGYFVAANGTPEQNYAYAHRVKSSDKQIHVDIIARSEDAELCLKTAKAFQDADLTECEEVVYDKGTYFDVYTYARDVKSANCEKAQEIMFDSNDADVIYAFAVDVEKADAYKCFNKLQELKLNNEKLFNVYKKMPAGDKLKVQLDEIEANIKKGKSHINANKVEAIVYYLKQMQQNGANAAEFVECQKRCVAILDAKLLLALVKNFNNFDLSVLGEKIAECGNGMQNYEFINFVYEQQMKNGAENFDENTFNAIVMQNNIKVLEYGDVYSSYLIAKNFPVANKEQHEYAVLNSKDIVINTEYAMNVKNANIEKHQAVVETNGRVEEIVNFAQKVKGANLEKIYLALKNKEANQKVLKAFERKLNNDQKISAYTREILG